jgi:hypothetical protein
VTVPVTTVVDSFKQHPWIVRLSRYVELADADVDAILGILEGQRQVRKRADIVIEGYKYKKFCFIEAGIASRYKLLHNGKRPCLGIGVVIKQHEELDWTSDVSGPRLEARQ